MHVGDDGLIPTDDDLTRSLRLAGSVAARTVLLLGVVIFLIFVFIAFGAPATLTITVGVSVAGAGAFVYAVFRGSQERKKRIDYGA